MYRSDNQGWIKGSKRMLPDYPRVKAKQMESYRKLMIIAHQQRLGPFRTIRPTFMHEGEAEVLSREDGSNDEMTPKHMQAAVTIPAPSANVEDVKLEDILRSFAEMGQKLADQQVAMIVDSIDEATKKTGNQIGPQSDPVELYFAMIESVAIDFDGNQQPRLDSFFVAPEDHAQRMRAAKAQIEATPDLRSRMELLMERKRGEFHDREAARQLAE
jgi:hypothetical protein